MNKLRITNKTYDSITPLKVNNKSNTAQPAPASKNVVPKPGGRSTPPSNVVIINKSNK